MTAAAFVGGLVVGAVVGSWVIGRLIKDTTLACLGRLEMTAARRRFADDMQDAGWTTPRRHGEP